MHLAIDIGNSHIKGAFFEDGHPHQVFRVPAARDASREAIRRHLRREIAGKMFDEAGVVSVVPDRTGVIAELLEEMNVADVRILTVTDGPLSLAYTTPDTLGIDRFAAAVGGYSTYGTATGQRHGPRRPVVVIDAGTAVTYEVVDADGVYLGGMISPGPGLLRDALVDGTAQLPTVDLILPEKAIGRSTTEALQAGIMSASIDAVRGGIERVRDELSTDPFAVLTGGWSDLLEPHLRDLIDRVDRHLTLRGVHEMLRSGSEPDTGPE